jgi:hypothetical protein
VNTPEARSVVAVLLATVVGLAILAPIAGRIMSPDSIPTLPDTVISGLADLLKVLAGGLISWLATSNRS